MDITETVNGGIVGFFSLEMSAEQLANTHHCGANRNLHPSRSVVEI